MHDIALFVEDAAHEAFLSSVVRKLAKQLRKGVRIRALSASGGFGRMTAELKRYAKQLSQHRVPMPDVLLVATDANCKGRAKRTEELNAALGEYVELAVLAIPDPHIERWYLLDSAAFKQAIGKGCTAPGDKCERDRYKNLLSQAIREAGKEPIFEGIEYASDIVDCMDFDRMMSGNNSLSELLGALMARMRNLD